jgi:hypothetical protein
MLDQSASFLYADDIHNLATQVAAAIETAVSNTARA